MRMNSTSRRMMTGVALVLLASVVQAIAGENAPAARTKSWIWVDASNGGKPIFEGDPWEVIVEYNLDAADDKGGTLLTVWGAGPWIDCPDGKYEKDRHHVAFPKGGFFAQVKVAAGQGEARLQIHCPPGAVAAQALHRRSVPGSVP
jgi:hypothetical protein